MSAHPVDISKHAAATKAQQATVSKTSASRACDQCNSRKVKCFSHDPTTDCAQCLLRSTKCTYLKTPAKRGPKSKRDERSLRTIENIATFREKKSDIALAIEHIGNAVSHPSSMSDIAATSPSIDDTEESSDLLLADHGNGNEGTAALEEATLAWADDTLSDWTWATAPQIPDGLDNLPTIDSQSHDFASLSMPLSGVSFSEEAKVTSLLNQYGEQFQPAYPIMNLDLLRERVKSRQAVQEETLCSLMESVQQVVSVGRKSETHNREETENHMMIDWSPRIRSGPIDFYTIMTGVHLFVGWLSLKNSTPAWYRLQELISLTLLSGLSDRTSSWYEASSPKELEERLRLTLFLYVCERASLILLDLPELIRQPLRLEDDVADYAAGILVHSSSHEAADILHLFQLYKVMKAKHTLCWLGACKAPCNMWSGSARLLVEEQLASVSEQLSQPGSDPRTTVQNINRKVTTLWMQDRFWNLLHRHNLVQPDGKGALGTDYIVTVIEETAILVEYATTFKIGFGRIGWSKLKDIVNTATLIMSKTKSHTLTTFIRSSDASRLLSACSKLVNGLAAIGRRSDEVVRELSRLLET